MAQIKNLKPGQIVYSLVRQRMGNTTVSRTACYPVKILEVHDNHVIASWNGNPPGKAYEADVRRWKVKKPKPKG